MKASRAADRGNIRNAVPRKKFESVVSGKYANVRKLKLLLTRCNRGKDFSSGVCFLVQNFIFQFRTLFSYHNNNCTRTIKLETQTKVNLLRFKQRHFDSKQIKLETGSRFPPEGQRRADNKDGN